MFPRPRISVINHIFSCERSYATQWITFGLPDILEIVAYRGQRTTESYVIKVPELISEVGLDLGGRLEAVVEVLAEYKVNWRLRESCVT